jgi:hypothetical protein
MLLAAVPKQVSHFVLIEYKIIGKTLSIIERRKKKKNEILAKTQTTQH